MIQTNTSVRHCDSRNHRGRERSWPRVLNDVHAKINRTTVNEVVVVREWNDIVRTVHRANRDDRPVSISGGRHAMGGQQFASHAIHLDMRSFNRVLAFDATRGTITVEAGMQWPKLLLECFLHQRGTANRWGIVQKQTGADRLSIGGAVSANIHGRCLARKPFVQDIESLVVIDARGRAIRCSRDENYELFQLVVGGYGLFGVVASVTIRLGRREKVQRVVELMSIDRLMSAFAQRIAEGYLYGDFQFAIDSTSPDFLRSGVFSCYRPVSASTPILANQLRLSHDDWNDLIYLAHVDKRRAFERFRDFYLASSGQIYWSDTHQAGYYLDDYHEAVDQQTSATHRATEIITELYVPRTRLCPFMDDARSYLREQNANLIYGTIRLIERDDESFLNWAREDFACVIFNLHTEHTPEGLTSSRCHFRQLIDLAMKHGGSFYLTYHRFAAWEQVIGCYPQFPEFLRLKKKYDPQLRFQSEWYRHYERECCKSQRGPRPQPKH